MSVLAEDWMPRALRLAEELAAAGKLWSARWREPICAVPRATPAGAHTWPVRRPA
ncbi:MAG: hypothetical protein JO364_01880 [Pseudonocardiales bacterium]|nr:hypothetical protein [Pseudonocardiales bacterium]MBV9029062.1 hypothetical protein [Pseudonocardiales bacterium]